MRVSTASALALLSFASLAVAQTFTSCNPLTASCPADPAFGKSETFDFTKGSSSEWSPSGSPSYSGSNGATFTVSKKGDSPMISSNWYIMFGHVSFVIQAAPGTGIVSSAVLQSDDLDEIDWEWIGGVDGQVQTNYFGKGNTQTYDRGASYPVSNTHDTFHTYTIDWTADHVIWQVDGVTVRTLTPQTADANQYPQTPMKIKVGVWAGGDPSNSQGTIQWAGGVTNYANGPYNMYAKSISVTDYSTGSQYKYSDHSGTWESIQAVGGSVNGNSGSAVAVSTAAADPATTSSVTGTEPIPFSGTHRDSTSSTVPSVFPWVSGSTSVLSGSIPSGWPTSSGASRASVKASPSPSSSYSSGSGSSSSGQSTLVTTSVGAQQTSSATSSATTAPPKSAAAVRSFGVGHALGIFCIVAGSAFALL